MREKQILQIQGFIHNELKGQLMTKENSERLYLMKQMEENLEKEISRKMKFRKMEKNQKEIFNERKLLNEFEENQRKLEEKEFEKLRKIQEKKLKKK